MNVFQNIFFDTFQIWFVVVIFSGVVLQLWCWYGDTVLDMILIWCQLWFLMWVQIVLWNQPKGTISKILSKPDRNRIKIISTAYRNRIKTVSKSYQNRITIISKSYHNHKNARKIDQKPVAGLFLFFFAANSIEPYQNRIKIISNPRQVEEPRTMWATMQKVSAASGERVIFSINADTTKIHRRVKVPESDWGVSEALRHGPRRFGPTRLGLHQRHTSGVVWWDWLAVMP